MRPITKERKLRKNLHESVRRLSSALGNCPAAANIQSLDERSAAAFIDEVDRALQEAVSCVQALETLENASKESALLCATSRITLVFVSEALANIVAGDPRAA
jgi:hypothetical protein